MAEPTDKQLKEYVAGLPDVYQYILKAYPSKQPNRQAGDGLTEDSIVDSFADIRDIYSIDEVSDALDQLVQRDFLKKQPSFRFFSPTELGERLIRVLTGSVPRSSKAAPPLPELAWN